MTAPVTPDAVEAAARAIHAARCDLPVACGRATSPDRQAAQLALAAAAPLIAQQALLDAAIDLNNHAAAMSAPDATGPCEFANEGLCHHDTAVATYATAAKRLTARAATLTPKDTP